LRAAPLIWTGRPPAQAVGEGANAVGVAGEPGLVEDRSIKIQDVRQTGVG
jgi:hypothetical protein